MRFESGEKSIATGMEPSATDGPAGSSRAPVGIRGPRGADAQPDISATAAPSTTRNPMRWQTEGTSDLAGEWGAGTLRVAAAGGQGRTRFAQFRARERG